MARIKPEIDDRDVRSLLSAYFGAPVFDLDAAQSGQIARTYYFSVGGQEFVVRFNRDNMGANLAKEAYLHANYSSPRIPIAEILDVGSYGDLHFAISRRAPGQPLTTLPPAEFQELIPALVDTLNAIHSVTVSDDRGYGTFADDGAGLYSSWTEYLATIREEEDAVGFHGRWHSLFQDSFLERDVFDQVYDRMIQLLPYLPADRHLVHGNYGFDNIIAHEGRITGVLDWIEAKYGDFVYDVAWLDHWSPGLGFAEMFRTHYAERGVKVPAYEERLRCYRCYIGLDALRFFAKVGDRAGYEWTRQRVLAGIG